MEDDEQEVLERVRGWVDRLEAFVSALDEIDGESATDFANNACPALQDLIKPSITPGRADAAVLLLLEALAAITRTTTTVIMDWADTPDVRDRYTRDSAQQRLKDALESVLSDSKRWLSEGLPSFDQIRKRVANALASMQQDGEVLGARNADLEAQDAEAEADRYGAIFIHLDPSRSDTPICEKVCSLTEEDDKRYRDAYERLRRVIDSELLEHIDDESTRFCDQLIAVLVDLRDNRISLFDFDAWDEHRRKIRSALISFTVALQVHQEQTVNAAKKTFGRKTPQVAAVEKLFKDLRKSSFDYGWLEVMRDALQHGDINAFRWGFGASMHDEPTANVYMNREFMLQFTSRGGNKPGLKRRELEDRDSDPSVLDMIKAIQPLMGPLQEELDKILYPDVADDVATLRELLSKYPSPMGLHALQDGPGFTRRNRYPPLSPMAARVLQFVATYEPDEDSDDDSDGSAVIDGDD